MPHRLLYVTSAVPSLILHLLVKVIYRPVSGLKAIRGWLPYTEYMIWLSRFGFKHTHHVVFDQLVAPVAYYIPRTEFEGWFDRAALQHVQITWRNQNSWRGYGRAK